MRLLRVLVLHSLGPLENVPVSLKNHVFALRTYHSEHEYVFHDTTVDNPLSLAGGEFDAIILDVSFLWARWAPDNNFQRIKREYSFIADCQALKLAFPQDEYDCNELLDDWMCEWRVDVVFSVIAQHWDVLYPKFSQTGEIRLAYTGYIDDSLTLIEPLPWDSRTIDIGYRARKLPPYFGRLGEVKWKIGELVRSACQGTSIRADIVVGDQGTLNGRGWLEFINRSRFTLGANSGSSLLDPRGHIQRAVRRYLQDYPCAPFKEVEKACFPGLDARHEFTAISPRVIEAAVLGSCQILVEGHYSGLLQPWEHYIPIKADASDFDKVLAAMQNRALTDSIVARCRADLLGNEDLHYRSHTARVIELIAERTSFNRIAAQSVEKRAIIHIKLGSLLMILIQRNLYLALRTCWRALAPGALRTWFAGVRNRL
jgi:hypothetical protein